MEDRLLLDSCRETQQPELVYRGRIHNQHITETESIVFY